MSKEGPLPGFDIDQGGKFHLHSDGRWGTELTEFQLFGAGIIIVDNRSFRIVDYCPVGIHHHAGESQTDGVNVELKNISQG